MSQTNTRIKKEGDDPSTLLERLQQYAILVRLNRPIGILLLLWPTLWALWIAGDGRPDLLVTVVFVLGVALMRSAGCAINDYADRNIDGEVKRTCQRPIATGKVSPREALMVFAVLSLVAFGLVLLLNWQTVVMSSVALVLAAVYPFMKRYTHLPQLVLGMAFGWAVPMAYMALTGTVTPEAWLLYIATVMWALIYDTQYAMVDREDDLRIGVKSTAILFGDSDITIIGMIQVFMICLLILVGVKEELGVTYFLGVVAASLLAVYQQYLIRNRDPAGCFAAFLNNNYFGLVVFLGIVIDFAVRS